MGFWEIEFTSHSYRMRSVPFVVPCLCPMIRMSRLAWLLCSAVAQTSGGRGSPFERSLSHGTVLECYVKDAVRWGKNEAEGIRSGDGRGSDASAPAAQSTGTPSSPLGGAVQEMA